MSIVAKELRTKTNEELCDLVIKCKEQLLQIRFNIANGEAEKLHTIKEIKKTIARSLTILNERNSNINNPAVNQAKTKKASKKGSGK